MDPPDFQDVINQNKGSAEGDMDRFSRCDRRDHNGSIDRKSHCSESHPFDEYLSQDEENQDGENKVLLAMEGTRSPLFAAQQQSAISLPGLNQNSSSVVAGTNCGIHEYFYYTATKHNVSCWTSLGMVCLSWLVLCMQLSALCFAAFENGYKDDFSMPLQKDELREYYDIDDDEVLLKEAGYDDDRATIAEECPFLTQNLNPGVSSTYAVIFIFIFVLSFVVNDMDQNAETVRATKYRSKLLMHYQEVDNATSGEDNGEESEGPRRCGCASYNAFLLLNIWAFYYTRGYFLPALTCTATIAIILREEITVQGVILNGLAITLIGCKFLLCKNCLCALITQYTLTTLNV